MSWCVINSLILCFRQLYRMVKAPLVIGHKRRLLKYSEGAHIRMWRVCASSLSSHTSKIQALVPTTKVVRKINGHEYVLSTGSHDRRSSSRASPSCMSVCACVCVCLCPSMSLHCTLVVRIHLSWVFSPCPLSSCV